MRLSYYKLFSLCCLGLIVGFLVVLMLATLNPHAVLAQMGTPTPCRPLPNACPANAAAPVMGIEPAVNSIATIFKLQAQTHNIPAPLLMAIGYKESSWHHFEAPAGQVGCTIMSITGISCDYGLMQINWVHNGSYDFSQIASDYDYNIWTGATILSEQWAYRPQVNFGKREQYIDWYNALWGYNHWSINNNPTRFPRNRIWEEADKSFFPYQEKILYTAQEAASIDGLSRWASIGPFTVPDDELFGEADIPLRDIVIFNVEANPPAFSYTCDADQTTFEYTLETLQPVTTQITIYNKEPWDIETIALKTLPSGVNTWDGTNDAGQPLAAGLYWFRVVVSNSSADLIGLQSKPVRLGCQQNYLPLVLYNHVSFPLTCT